MNVFLVSAVLCDFEGTNNTIQFLSKPSGLLMHTPHQVPLRQYNLKTPSMVVITILNVKHLIIHSRYLILDNQNVETVRFVIIVNFVTCVIFVIIANLVSFVNFRSSYLPSICFVMDSPVPPQADRHAGE